LSAYKDRHGRWRWRFTFKGKRYSGSAPLGSNTKATAEKLERTTLDRLVARKYDGVMPTFEQFAPRFIAYQLEHTKPLTHLNHEHVSRNHLVPHLGKLKLDEIGVEDIDGLKSMWKCAPSTKNMRLRVLRRCLLLAVEWGILDKAPRFKMLKLAHKTPRFFSQDEAAKLLDVALPQWRELLLIALRTGLRIGELRGLRWSDIDLIRRTVHVQRTSSGKAKFKAMGTTKSNRARMVPLSPDATAALAALKSPKAHPDSLVWPGRTKREARSEAGCDNAIKRMLKLAGIQERGLGWHTCRHTFASWLAIRGVSLRVIQELLGHSSITVTEIYAHLAPGATHHEHVAGLDLNFVSEHEVAALRQPTAKTIPARSESLADTNG
jgi:integrase